MDTAIPILIIGAIVFVSHWFAGIFERKGIPDVLLLMLIGLLAGPILEIVEPRDFGITGPMFTSITLVFILFEGGLGLRIKDLQDALGGSTSITIVNFFVTMVVVGLLAFFVLNLDFLVALTLGAILGGTSSAVVIPMVHLIKLHEESKTILILESAISDVLCIVFAIALMDASLSGEIKVGLIIGKILSSFIIASIVGVAGAFVWAILLNKIRTIKNSIFTTPAFVFVVYGISEMLGYSGAISALLFGITLVNIEQFSFAFLKKYIEQKPISLNQTERIFMSEIVFLLKSLFFIYIGISIQFDNMNELLLGLIFTVVIFAIRIPVVRGSINNHISTADKSIMAIMVPKGLAAAVLASMPLQAGVPGGETVKNITYSVVLFSIIFTSMLCPLVTRNRSVQVFYGWLMRVRFLGFLKRFKKVEGTKVVARPAENEPIDDPKLSNLPNVLNAENSDDL